MPSRELQRQMYEIRDASVAQRLTLAALVGLWVAAAWWLLWGGGLATIGGWFGRRWVSGDAARRLVLAVGLSIYYVRILFTEFVFLKRGVSWSEVFTVVPWILCIYLLLGTLGGTNTAPFGAAGWTGVVLFVAGSWMNTYSEYARHRWKQLPENRGRLYTEGLFRYSRHPNYLGDLLSFTGLCLISGRWITAGVPVLMLAGFVLVNIPVLDSHLRDRYGADFDQYAERTRRLIPFVY
jgi:steroid 5-alpha reductase family enzyme